MTMRLIWFILAGFLLGFTASTLWEWFHFRRERMKLESNRIAELETQLANEQNINAQLRIMLTDAEPFDEALEELPQQPSRIDNKQIRYSSPGVFLDSETSNGDHREADRPSFTQRGINEVPVLPADAGDGDMDFVNDNGNEIARNPTGDSVVEIEQSRESIPEEDSESVIIGRLAAELVREKAPRPAPEAVISEIEMVPRSHDFPDNLSKIKGIGDVYKFRLFKAGIYTWHQVSETDVETLRTATNAYPGANVDEWPEQAQRLAEKHGRQNAYYSGPPPDDLTQIVGIGPVGQYTLYNAGICTYEQLASVTVAELKTLFPIAIAGDEPNFAQWIGLAVELSKAKAK